MCIHSKDIFLLLEHNDEIVFKMANTVFIIGNGFDIDVNFRTKYSDYYNIWCLNNLWPFEGATSGLGGYINYCAKTERWLDLEMALFNYVSADNGVAKKDEQGNYPVDSDRRDFDALVRNLTLFINRIPCEDKVDRQAVASVVLKTILDTGNYSIYSFNYTNLRKIANRLYPTETSYAQIDYTPIHGSVENDNIILGIHSDANIIDGYEFLRKIDQPHYKLNNLQQEIDSASEVVFFGLSMGKVDNVYFRDFFGKFCKGVIPIEEKKHVTIFTYDETSRIQILKQLRDLTGTDLLKLKSNCYFDIIRTSECSFLDKEKFDSFQKRLSSNR